MKFPPPLPPAPLFFHVPRKTVFYRSSNRSSDLRVCTPTAVGLGRKSVVRISRFLLGSFRRSHGDFTLRNFDGCHAYPGYDNLSKIHPSLPKSCIASLFYRIFSGFVLRRVLEVRGAYRNQITSCSREKWKGNFKKYMKLEVRRTNRSLNRNRETSCVYKFIWGKWILINNIINVGEAHAAPRFSIYISVERIMKITNWW